MVSLMGVRNTLINFCTCTASKIKETLRFKNPPCDFAAKSKNRLKPTQILQAIQFSERLIDTRLWIEKADGLISAANLLEEDILKYWSEIQVENNRTVSEPNRKCAQEAYFLLIAYALENFFKALLIYRNQETLKGRLKLKLPKYLKEHDLIKLASKAKFSTKVYEEELFCRLSRFSIWKARYPVPIDFDALHNVKILSDERAYFTDYYKPQDIGIIHNIIDRLRKHVVTEIGVDV